MCFVDEGWLRFTDLTPEEMLKEYIGGELSCLLLVCWPLQVQVWVHNVCQDQTVSDYVRFVSSKGFSE